MATQRVPAWKRLGLKLKAAEPQADTLSTPTAPQRPDATFQRDGFDSPKRKREHFGDSNAAKPSLKKSKTDDRTPLRRQKSVTFAEGQGATKQAAPEPKKAKATPKKKKGPKTPKPEAPISPPDLTVPLEYLRLWKTSRDNWKFNKNHQAHLVSHTFDSGLFPAADIDTFYEYIRELKGYARTRLLETAKNICTEDMDGEKDHFPAGTTDVESKKKQYEEILSNVLRPSQTEPKRKRFHEAEFATSRDVDPEVARRVAKRMRAEIITEELSSESDSSETTGGSNVATTSEKETSEKEASGNEVAGEPDAGKRLKLNDGTTRAVKRVRASKRRGADLDDSSSESDSDSDSDNEPNDGSDSSDDSSTDSSESSDDEMDVDSRPDNQETSSSSSSSSDEDEDSDEDSDSDED